LRVAATCDYDADGVWDVLLQDTGSAELGMLLLGSADPDGIKDVSMRGFGFGFSSSFVPAGAVVASGDFDGDARCDIATHDLEAGEIELLYMNGEEVDGSERIADGGSWSLVGVGQENPAGQE
jgi:hypothetical protein